MNVGISCLVTPRDWSYEQTLQNTKAAGYESLELIIRDEGEITLDTPDSELAALARRAGEVGMQIASVCPAFRNAPKDVMTNDADVRAQSLETIRQCIRVAKGLGTDTMLLTLGALTPDLYYNEAYANALQALQKLAPAAEEAGVNVAIEYVWNKFLLSPMEFARFCDEVGSPRVGFYFDPGNMAIFGFPEHWVRICGRHVMKVHMKDFKRQGAQWPPLLGGDVDFPRVMAELRKIGYDGALLSEVGPSIAPLEVTAESIRKIMRM